MASDRGARAAAASAGSATRPPRERLGLAQRAILVAALGGSVAVFGAGCRQRPPAQVSSGAGTGAGTSAAGPGDGGEPHASEQSALAALIGEQLDAELQFAPTQATWLGDHGLDDRLDDVRAEAVAREVARLYSVLDRLRRLREAIESRSPVAPRDAKGEASDGGTRPSHRESALRLDLALLQGRIEAKLQELTEARPHERSPLFYINVMAFGLDSLLGPNLFSQTGMRALRGRLAAIPALCKEAQRNLKNPPEIWTRRALEVGQMTRDFVAVILPRLLSMMGPTQPDPKLGEEVAQRRAEAQKALEEFVAWLGRDLLPRSKGEWAVPREKLAARLHALELLDVPLDTVQAVAEAEHRETRRRFDELARRITAGTSSGQSAARTAADAMKLVEEDHPRPEELLRAAEAAIDKAYELTLAEGLLTVPDDAQPGWSRRPKVAEMPAYRFGYVLLSMAAPLEPEREAQLWIDPVDPNWTDKKRIADHLRMLSRAQLWLSTIHEVVPGHFTQQLVVRQHAGSLTPLRQRTFSVAFLEGWSSYAEQLLALEGAGAQAVGEKVQLLALRTQLLRLGRLLSVLRLHAAPGSPSSPPQPGGTSPPAPSPGAVAAAAQARLDEVVRFLIEECYLDEYAARREAERATYDLLAGLAALGRLQLIQLRRDYLAEHGGSDGKTAAEAGDPLRLQAFHDTLLAHGSLPVVALRSILLQKSGPSLLPPPPEPPEAAEDQ